MEDMDLHFTKADTYENQPKARKPFPVDFSFNRDGVLTDSAIEEVRYEIPQETAEEFEEIFETFREDFPEDDTEAAESCFESDEAEDQTEFSDEFIEDADDFHSEPAQCDSGIQQIEEGCADTFGNRLLQDNCDAGDGGDEEAFGDEISFLEDEDDSALWDEFKDIFEIQEADDADALEETEQEETENEEDLAQFTDFDDGETELQVLPILDDADTEEAVAFEESEEDDSETEDEEDLAQFTDFDDAETEFQVLPILEDADTEEVVAFEESEEDDSETENEEDLAQFTDFDDGETEIQVLPILEDADTEEAVAFEESEEDDSETEAEEDLAQFTDFDDGETEFQVLPILEDTDTEEAVEFEESEEDDSETEDGEDLAQFTDFDDAETEIQVLPVFNQEKDTGDEAAESKIQPMFIDLSESNVLPKENDFATSVFPESDTDCESVVIPTKTVSVTTWERARQRASANVHQDTIETEHFFAVSERYINEGRGVERQPADDRTPTISPVREEADDIQPIWQIDEPGTTDWDTEPEIQDEDLDYDDIFNDDHDSYRKKKRVKNIFKKIFKEFVIFLLIVFSAIFLVANFTVFVSRQNTVYGSSMEPTLYEGDHVYTTLLPYIFGEPEIGDIIVLNYSEHEQDRGYFHMIGEVLRNNRLSQWILGKDKVISDTYWIKRVVAVAGDVVSFENNRFYRNGEVVTEDYLLDQNVTKYNNGEEILVPEGSVFVMGDNRNISHDSRVIGCISTDIIIGKMWKKG